MQQVVSAMVGTTASGRLRYSGCICCSTEAKKLFRSMCRKPKRSDWKLSGIGEPDLSYSLFVCRRSRSRLRLRRFEDGFYSSGTQTKRAATQSTAVRTIGQLSLRGTRCVTTSDVPPHAAVRAMAEAAAAAAVGD